MDGAENTKAVLEALGLDAWREDAQAKSGWVGNVIAGALGLDVDDADDKASIKRMIKAWIKEKVLERVQKKDKNNGAMRWYVKAKNVTDV